jgi:hypothetical protein
MLTANELSVDALRKLGGYPHYLGLGVIKCRIGSNSSYHFYCDRAPILVNQIHDHRFGFTSTILVGRLRNIIYEIAGQDPTSTLQVERGECKKGAEREVLVENAKMVEVDRFVTSPGESYYIAHDTLHMIEHLDPVTITYLEKEPFAKLEPRFVVDTSLPRVCAMSQPKSQDECWEVIEYALGLIS